MKKGKNMALLREDVFCEQDEKTFSNLVQNSLSMRNVKLTFEKIEEKYGWVYIKAKIDNYEFSIKYSSYMTDTADFTEFLSDVCVLKEAKAFVFDNEGSFPIICIQPVDKDNIRFFFAHDYDLFLKNIDYDFSNYKVECDVIINKKEFLQNFYKILYPFTCDYKTDENSNVIFKPEKAKTYLKKIKEYLI